MTRTPNALFRHLIISPHKASLRNLWTGLVILTTSVLTINYGSAMASNESWMQSAFGESFFSPRVSSYQKRSRSAQNSVKDSSSAIRNSEQSLLLGASTLKSLDAAISRYQSIVASGGWKPIPNGPKLRIGSRNRRVALLQRRLWLTGDLPRNTSASQTFDKRLQIGVKRFQNRHGLTLSGEANRRTLAALNVPAQKRLHQLRINRSRVQVLRAKTVGKKYVLVNIPAYVMQAVSNGRVDLVSRVMVGKPQTPTPIIQTYIRAIDFYPHWHIPQSIAKRALVPALKKNPNYLIRERIRVFESWGGREVDARRINWRFAQKNNSYVYRQDPGRFNALGVIRIDMPNNENVYMHDTPMKKLFRYNLRPYSAGCVRVQKIVGLTEWLLKGQGSWNRPRINTTIVAEAQSSVTLSHHVPVYFSYITAWARPNGIAHFRSDIYNKDIQNVKMANADMRK